VCVCIALCTIVAHNIAQNRPDNFPSYPPDNRLFRHTVSSQLQDECSLVGANSETGRSSTCSNANPNHNTNPNLNPNSNSNPTAYLN